MAKRTRAPARARKAARRRYRWKHLPVSRRYGYTPELLADGCRRYEQTDERVVDIAADFGCHKTTLQRLANRAGWLRHAPPPRDLPAAAKLAAAAEVLTQIPFIPTQAGIQEQDSNAGAVAPGSPLARGRTDDDSMPTGSAHEPPPVAATVARLHAAVLAELAAVEAMRAALKHEPQKPADAALTARTLALLTDTLNKIQRLQCAQPQTGPDYDDMPADLDEFRDELARRIRAFFAARRGRGDADGDAAPPVAAGG
jgi:hypothetical protein